jgi:hypothetical protein
MRGCLTAIVALCVLVLFVWGLGVMLSDRVMGSGLENFEGRERWMASQALFHIADFYGNGSLEVGDYNGPPLVLGWHVESVEECPGTPSRKEIEGNHYRAVIGAHAKVRAYSLFGIPRGEMEVTCRGHRKWEPYF